MRTSLSQFVTQSASESVSQSVSLPVSLSLFLALPRSLGSISFVCGTQNALALVAQTANLV